MTAAFAPEAPTGIVEQLLVLANDVDSLSLVRLAAITRSIHNNIDKLTSSRDKTAIECAKEVLHRCALMVDAEGIFSANECLEDISTSDLPLLLTPFVYGELLCSNPATGPAHRYRQVHAAAAAYSTFLHRLEQYSLLGDLASKQYAQEEEAGESAGASNPTDRRQAKIERFKREKAISAQLAQIESQRSRSRRDLNEDGEEAASLGGPSGLDEEDERKAWLLRIESAAMTALENRAAMREEQKLLKHAAEDAASAASAPTAERDLRQRQQQQQQAQEAENRARVLSGLTNVAAQLAAASNGIRSNNRNNTSSATQHMSSAVAAVAGLQSERDRLLQGVFRPSHNLPTMTVEQFGMLELQEAQQREQAEKAAHAERERARAERTTGGGEYDEEEEEKQRKWDDFKDSNPKGWGNSALRPCGR